MVQLDNLDELFQNIAREKVAIVGDVMLDTYWWGHVDRISPEAPVPIVSFDRREQRIGGAGNVALNTVSLGAQTSIFSVIGNDDDAVILKALLSKHHIDTGNLIKSDDRITTNKIRVISRNQQVVRLDAETTKEISGSLEIKLIKTIERYIKNERPTVVILEDYNKGVLTERVITSTISLCRQYGVLVSVDPKSRNFFLYKQVDIFKPNMKEVREGLNIAMEDINLLTLKKIHRALSRKLQHQISLITLSDKGIFYHAKNQARIVPSHLRSIADVSGAGDTVIAVASLVYGATKNVHLMTEVANIAGGLVCEQVGTAAIDCDQLLNECKLLLQ